MKKKTLLAFFVVMLIVFSFSYVFATDMMQDAANGVRDAMNATENTMENAAQGASNVMKDMTQSASNTMDNAMNTTENAMQNVTGNDDNYTATRTSTTTDGNTFMGMNGTTWTWIIMGIAAIAIVALVWYYSMQLTEKNYDNKND